MVQPTEGAPNVPFEQLLSLRPAMKKHMERNPLKSLMMEVVEGLNISLLIHGPPGDMLLFDLSQSLLGFCHEKTKQKNIHFQLLLYLPLVCSLAELSSTRGGCFTQAGVTLCFTQHGLFGCCSFA